MSQVFVSYARKDGSEIADELADKLRILGHSVFLDVHTIPGGSLWRQELNKHIRWADLVIVLVTPESNKSAAVYEEFTEASKLKKVILPIQIGDADLPVHIANKHAIRYVDKNIDAVLLQIERTLKNQSVRTFPYRLILLISIIVLIAFSLFIFKDEIRFTLFPINIFGKEFSIVDKREILGEVKTEKTEPIDNSLGTSNLSQDIVARRQFRYKIETRLNDSAGLNPRDVEDRILETYDLIGEIGEQLCLIPADVPAGRIYLYDVEWTTVLHEGNIEEGSTLGNGEILGTYQVVVDMQCQVTGVNVLQ